MHAHIQTLTSIYKHALTNKSHHPLISYLYIIMFHTWDVMTCAFVWVGYHMLIVHFVIFIIWSCGNECLKQDIEKPSIFIMVMNKTIIFHKQKRFLWWETLYLYFHGHRHTHIHRLCWEIFWMIVFDRPKYVTNVWVILKMRRILSRTVYRVCLPAVESFILDIYWLKY